MKDIHVFLGCASFYQGFIQGLNKLAEPLTSMLRTITAKSAKNLPLDMAEDAEFENRTSSKTRLADNSSASGTWLRMLRLVEMMRVVMMKWLKNHLFPRSLTYLRNILPPYALKKDEFPLIVFGNC